MSYARYKFHKAMHSLDYAGQRKREWLAGEHVYRILRLKLEDVPAEIRHELRQFQQDMTSVKAKKMEDSVRATVRAMNEPAVSSMIGRIVSMRNMIDRSESTQSMQ